MIVRISETSREGFIFSYSGIVIEDTESSVTINPLGNVLNQLKVLKNRRNIHIENDTIIRPPSITPVKILV